MGLRAYGMKSGNRHTWQHVVGNSDGNAREAGTVPEDSHDLKKDGIDRTKDELIEDMEIIYEKYGKTPPKHF